jgi:hypothetical protein
MREVIKHLKATIGEFVICGSLALYLHGLIPDYNNEEIDIIVDSDIKIDGYTRHINNRFNARGWMGKYNDVYIDVYNKPLPEFDKVVVDGLVMRIKTVNALKTHYLSLDLDKMEGHDRFKQKLMTRIELFK